VAASVGKSLGYLFIELIDPRQAGEWNRNLLPVQFEEFEKPPFVGGESIVREADSLQVIPGSYLLDLRDHLGRAAVADVFSEALVHLLGRPVEAVGAAVGTSAADQEAFVTELSQGPVLEIDVSVRKGQ
jgi:hypothetical protein